MCQSHWQMDANVKAHEGLKLKVNPDEGSMKKENLGWKIWTITAENAALLFGKALWNMTFPDRRLLVQQTCRNIFHYNFKPNWHCKAGADNPAANHNHISRKLNNQGRTENSTSSPAGDFSFFGFISYLEVLFLANPNIQATLQVNRGFFWQPEPNFLQNHRGGRTAPGHRTGRFAEGRALSFCTSPCRALTRVLYVSSTRTSERPGRLWLRSAAAGYSRWGTQWSDHRLRRRGITASIWDWVLGSPALPVRGGLPLWGLGRMFHGQAPAGRYLCNFHPRSRRGNL